MNKITRLIQVISIILNVVAYISLVFVFGKYYLNYGFEIGFNACSQCDVSYSNEFVSCQEKYFPELEKINLSELNFDGIEK